MRWHVMSVEDNGITEVLVSQEDSVDYFEAVGWVKTGISSLTIRGADKAAEQLRKEIAIKEGEAVK